MTPKIVRVLLAPPSGHWQNTDKTVPWNRWGGGTTRQRLKKLRNWSLVTSPHLSTVTWTSVDCYCDRGSGGLKNFELGRSPGNNTSCLASQVTSFADRTQWRNNRFEVLNKKIYRFVFWLEEMLVCSPSFCKERRFKVRSRAASLTPVTEMFSVATYCRMPRAFVSLCTENQPPPACYFSAVNHMTCSTALLCTVASNATHPEEELEDVRIVFLFCITDVNIVFEKKKKKFLLFSQMFWNKSQVNIQWQCFRLSFGKVKKKIRTLYFRNTFEIAVIYAPCSKREMFYIHIEQLYKYKLVPLVVERTLGIIWSQTQRGC